MAWHFKYIRLINGIHIVYNLELHELDILLHIYT
jgi:hypothetical protein